MTFGVKRLICSERSVMRMRIIAGWVEGGMNLPAHIAVNANSADDCFILRFAYCDIRNDLTHTSEFS